PGTRVSRLPHPGTWNPYGRGWWTGSATTRCASSARSWPPSSKTRRPEPTAHGPRPTATATATAVWRRQPRGCTWAPRGDCDTGAMERTTVHRVRHGEVHNPEGILYGSRSGYRLFDRGRQMVTRVAEVLLSGGHDLRAVIASPLQRAQESALPA